MNTTRFSPPRFAAGTLCAILACGLSLQASAQDNRRPRPGGPGPGRRTGGCIMGPALRRLGKTRQRYRAATGW